MNAATLRVERTLQVCMGLLTTLAALVLGMGEENYVIPIMGAIAAVGSLYLTDIRGWLKLNNRQANLAGLVTVGICFWELRRVDVEQRVLALANLLFYLQCVNLFRRKDPRIYWMLALLSTLEVAVAGALSSSILFGWLLVLFFAVGMATLSLFLVLREHAEQRPAFGGAAATARAAPVDEFLTWPLARQLMRMGAGILGLMGVLFLMMPRADSNEWGETIVSGNRSVGFQSSGIHLSDTDEATEDPMEVLRVRLYYHDTKGEYELHEPLVLRGMVLTEYAGAKGKGSWSAVRGPARTETLADAAPQDLRGLVELEIVAQPMGRVQTLFGVFPFAKVSSSGDIHFDGSREMLFRQGQYVFSEFQYTLATPALRNHRQARLMPCRYPPARTGIALLASEQQTSLAELIKTAAEVVQGIPIEEAQRRAEALERYLRDSGQFSYALQPPPLDPNLDPIEHFVTQSRAGHCEYFASALALMLRSQNIPARVAMGFKTEEYNKLGHFYHVRQLHAHSWVEAYLAPDELPAELRDKYERGAWLRLDPTPAAGSGESAADKARRLPTVREVIDFTKYLWSSYVVGMNAHKQREAIYRPVADFARSLFSPAAWRESLTSVRSWIRGESAPPTRGGEGRVLALAILTLSLACYLGFKLLRPYLGRIRLRRTSPAVSRRERLVPVIDFYRRFEQLLAGHKLVRTAGQTQREFAVALGGQLADRVETHSAVPIPRQVVDAFYRVRFGEKPLDSAEQQGVEQALSLLERTLKSPARSV